MILGECLNEGEDGAGAGIFSVELFGKVIRGTVDSCNGPDFIDVEDISVEFADLIILEILHQLERVLPGRFTALGHFFNTRLQPVVRRLAFIFHMNCKRSEVILPHAAMLVDIMRVAAVRAIGLAIFVGHEGAGIKRFEKCTRRHPHKTGEHRTVALRHFAEARISFKGRALEILPDASRVVLRAQALLAVSRSTDNVVRVISRGLLVAIEVVRALPCGGA